jgi:hypothetical protein
MRKHLQLRRLNDLLFLAGGQGFLNRFDYLIDLVQVGADVLEQELLWQYAGDEPRAVVWPFPPQGQQERLARVNVPSSVAGSFQNSSTSWTTRPASRSWNL